MNSKSTILLGLLASLLLIFLCIFFNAERYYKELGLGIENKQALSSEVFLNKEREEEIVEGLPKSDDTVVAIEDEDKVEVITAIEEKKEETSFFNYYIENNKTFISGKIPLLDNGDVFKELITDCSKDKLCENDVIFLDNDETLSWKAFVSSLLTLFKKEKIVDPKLLIDKKDIKIEGEFLEESGKSKLLSLLENHKESYNISDMTTVKKEVKVESKDKVLVEEVVTKEVSKKETKEKTPEKTLQVEEEKISSLLKKGTINFKRNSGKLKKEGEKVLDEISKLLEGQENILINVEGYTDIGGKEKINLWISQVRADGVKQYLIKKGIKADSITAKGFGEKKLLLPKRPYDPSNRRVEIHLKRK